mmetsp:Transcript_97746/g.273557  ORF Transcript_97746/g.273557 Transcript_97746/m.273557 type:complete len:233 (+) Transcript_97746:788-1486(+)
MQLHTVHGLVRADPNELAPLRDVVLGQLREARVVRRGLVDHLHVAILLGLGASSLGPSPADNIGGCLRAVRAQVQRNRRELSMASAVHEEDLVVGRDGHDAPQRQAGLPQDVGELRRAMRHRHGRQAARREPAGDLRLHRGGQRRRPGAEVREVRGVHDWWVEASHQRRMLGRRHRCVVGKGRRRAGLRWRISVGQCLPLRVIPDPLRLGVVQDVGGTGRHAGCRQHLDKRR